VDELGKEALDELVGAKLGKRAGTVERWQLASFLGNGETLATAAYAAHSGEAGLLAVTNRRVFHLSADPRDKQPRISFSVSRAGIVAAAVRRELMNTDLVLYDPNGVTFLTGISPRERAGEIAEIVAPGRAHAA
jgi:hypothetical protein